MYDAFLAQLLLSCIPQWVVSLGLFKFFERVNVGAGVFRVFPEGNLSPLG